MVTHRAQSALTFNQRSKTVSCGGRGDAEGDKREGWSSLCLDSALCKDPRERG